MQPHESASWAALGRRTSALRTVLVAAALAAIAVAASAAVTIRVDAVTNSDPATHFHADNDNNLTPPGGAIHGVAEAGVNGGAAFVANGGSGACDFFVPVPGCAFSLQQARAMGEVRGDLGRLRGAVYDAVFPDPASDIGSSLCCVIALLELGLRDSLTTTAAGDLRFDLHFDVNSHESGVFGLKSNPFQLHFNLLTSVDPGTPIEFAFEREELDPGLTVVDKSFLLPALPAGTQVFMQIHIAAEAECTLNQIEAPGSSCSLWTDFGNSAYIGVVGDYVSASGYAYPGFAATAPVPEPETAALLAAGLVVLTALRRRASRRR